jgi:hypothetical protein
MGCEILQSHPDQSIQGNAMQCHDDPGQVVRLSEAGQSNYLGTYVLMRRVSVASSVTSAAQTHKLASC